MSWSFVWSIEVDPLAEGNGNIKRKTIRVVAIDAKTAIDIVAKRYQELNESAVAVKCLGRENAAVLI